MKVLYIGNYKDGTGWANACLNNILALDSAGVDIVPRAITFEAQQQNYPQRIKDLEANSTNGCDICIQHTLPHLYSYDSRYKKQDTKGKEYFTHLIPPYISLVSPFSLSVNSSG